MIVPTKARQADAVAHHYDEIDLFYRDLWGEPRALIALARGSYGTWPPRRLQAEPACHATRFLPARFAA